MKSLKSRLIAAAILLALSGSQAPAQTPTITVGGKTSPDVYLQSLDISVEVTGNVAATRYTMIFKNKTNRILEGMLTFPLPDGRSATHYALDINGKMRDAVPVEKAKGTQVFEEIQQREVDPGLLERVEGNNMRTRIYPIPANGTRTVSIGYEEELPLEKGELVYRLPTAYPNPLEKFAVKATVFRSAHKPAVPKSADELRFDKAGDNYAASFSRANYRPAQTLIFSLPAPDDIPQVITQPAQGSHYFLASVAPKAEARKKQWNNDLAIIWDVSLSGTQRNLKREMEMLGIIFAEKKNAAVHLYFLNNKNVKKGEYKVVNGNWDGLKNSLNKAVFDGGTDFSQIKLDDIAGGEILFFSDGLSTLGDADFLTGAKQIRPLHCVVSSAKADYSAMKMIAGKTKGKFINVNALSAEKLKGELLNETLMFLGAEHGDALREVYPSVAAPVYGNFSVAGISDSASAELTLLFGFGGKVEKRIKVILDAKKAAKEGNTHKIWAQKKIAELDSEYEKNREELMALGEQFGIVTRNTSLIVLETISDYVLYGIEPPASEPELREEYHRRKGGEAKRLAAADGASSSGGGGGIDDLLSGLMGGPGDGLDLSKRRGGAPAPSGSVAPGPAPAPPAPDGSAAKRSRDFVFESEEVVGYLDNPTPIYIIDADDPNADDFTLNRSFTDALKENSDSDAMERLPPSGLKTGGQGENGVAAPLTARPKNKKRDTPIYANENPTANETPVAGVGPDDVLIIVDMTRKHYKVRAPSGEGGYVYGYVGKSALTRPYAAKKRMSDKQIAAALKEWAAAQAKEEESVARVMEEVAALEKEKAEKAAVRAAARERDAKIAAALSVAEKLRKWLDTDFDLTPQKPKYPMPDNAADGSNTVPAKAAAVAAKGSDYLKTMTEKAADDYRRYLKLRNDHANVPAFYFDAADWFYKLGDRETALRVLTSIADLELENASLYRLLGYRFKEYGEYALEKFVCRKVVEWRPMEPQSYRDYALALADNGEEQAALDSLCSMLTMQYSSNIRNRNDGIEEIAVTEVNRLIAKNPKLDASKIDSRLIINIPVDIRVVINWNMDNTDIDLHVADPNGEECNYNRRETRIGGRISNDITSGYGPEQFLLKKAVKGKYGVYVNYYGDRQFTAAGPSTVMAEIYTKYAGKDEQRNVISLQLSNAKKSGGVKVQVAEFEF